MDKARGVTSYVMRFIIALIAIERSFFVKYCRHYDKVKSVWFLAVITVLVIFVSFLICFITMNYKINQLCITAFFIVTEVCIIATFFNLYLTRKIQRITLQDPSHDLTLGGKFSLRQNVQAITFIVASMPWIITFQIISLILLPICLMQPFVSNFQVWWNMVCMLEDLFSLIGIYKAGALMPNNHFLIDRCIKRNVVGFAINDKENQPTNGQTNIVP
uniref:G_PROTEIN_RECEP_F1_2 domain-containing protein n=1 Tax=Rhabditophanes sp. KR3021 TaxID=114890 RepID=A0AC35TZR1_9BILA